jgi:imidazolonepropionase-like amidohydrolase
MTRLFTILFAICTLFSIICHAEEVLEYTVLSGGNPAGFQKTKAISKTEYSVEYEFNDRGRGPKLSTQIVLNPNGVPVSIQNTGNNYYKSAVSETFKVENDKASWKNSAEEGTKDFKGNEFYVSQTGVPEETAMLVRALLHANSQMLSLLPAGDAKLKKAGELQLEVDGQTRKVIQYAITGLDFVPAAIWMDTDETFFASGGSFLFVVRKGWEKAMDQIVKAQEASQAERLAHEAKELTQKRVDALMIRNAMLFDSEKAETKSAQTILIVGNRIKAVGVQAELNAPIGAKIIDADGKFVMPGLWDMHVHLGAPDGLLHISAGVTSVRDMANDDEELIKTKNKFDSGELIGPRILYAGFIDGPGPYAGPSKVLVDNEQQARAAVDKYAQIGVCQIKLYSSLKPELVAPIVDEARKKGLRVSGHIPAFMTAEQAIKEGYSEIQHINMLFLNFLFDIAKDTRTPLRFTAVAEHAAEMDFKSPQWQSFLGLLKEKHIIIDPTVSIFQQILTSKPGEVPAGYETVLPTFPPQVRRQLLSGGFPIPEGKEQLYKDSFRKMLELIDVLYKNNITIVAGTDDLAGYALHRELENYVAAGIPPAKVLQIATLTAAQVTKQDKDLGSITPGKFADLIIVDGDPTKNISDIRKVDTVIKDGLILKPAAIHQVLGISEAK